MKTVLKGTGSEILISPDHPTVLIGERINPTGRKQLAAALVAGDVSVVKREALAQVTAGASVIDVNVGVASIDQVATLPAAVKMVQEVVDVPISIDTSDPNALEAALKACQGKALINSVNGEEKILDIVLPLAAEYGAAVIGLCMDDDGIPHDPQMRLKIAEKIVKRAQALGISQEDVLIDCLAMAVSADSKAGLHTLDAIRLVRNELGVNMTLGASNVSFGLPDRPVLNRAFLAIAIREGVNAPIVDVERVRDTVLAADILLGRDEFARRYITNFRERVQKSQYVGNT